MTRTLYAVVIALIIGAYVAALLSIPSGRSGGYIAPPNVITTVAPGWVSVNGETPVPECAEGDDCNGPDYR